MKLEYKTVIGIRTHRWTHAEENLYTQLQQYFDSKDIFVVIDETAHTIDTPQHIQKVSLNQDYLNQNKLLSQHPHSNGLGWLCGDYFYYALADHVDADYYWLIEPDVAFTFDDLSEFFGRFQIATQDALLHNFTQAPTTWAWTERAKIIHREVYQAFFPLSRLSFKAIAACKHERQDITKHFKQHNTALSQFPNDESLVATALVKHKLNIEKLNHFFPNSFQYFTYRNTILGSHAKNLLPSQQIIHPFRQPEYLGEMLAKQMPTIEMNDTMLDSILRSTISIDDIDNVIQHIQQKVLSQIHVALKCHAMHKTLFLSIKNRFDAIAATPNQTIRYKSWIWKNNTVVLDATMISNGNTHTLEFIFEDNNLSCNLFSRSGEDKLWAIVRQKYAEYPLINQKVALFQHQNLTNIENEMIEKAIGIFNQIIQQIDINEQETQP